MENWKLIPDFPGYEASDQGRVRSFKRKITRVLTLIERPDGYLKVRLYRNGRQINRSVHRLMLVAFIGPCPPGFETLHRNGEKTDNRIGNLHWGSRSENRQDMIRLNERADQSGRKHPNYKHGFCCGDRKTPAQRAYKTAYNAAYYREHRQRLNKTR